MKIAIVAALAALLCQPVRAEEQFKDVPGDHWAAGSVQKLKDEGILRGYPDGTFKGNQPVTRYELAAALVRFTEFLQESRKPVSQAPCHDEKQPGCLDSGPGPGIGPAASLVDEGFLPKDSSLLKGAKKPVTSQELAEALAWVAKRMIELAVPEESEDGRSTQAQNEVTDEG